MCEGKHKSKLERLTAVLWPKCRVGSTPILDNRGFDSLRPLFHSSSVTGVEPGDGSAGLSIDPESWAGASALARGLFIEAHTESKGEG